ncbi:MAG: hypothetical protein OEW67_03215 [Cyclobacteriaceae bacterium]|nr:hypothetical protein [Cyclobacteriaceae bacterium]
MKKDINIPEVKNVTFAIIRKANDSGDFEWEVHLINNNDFYLQNIIVMSRGYGEKDGEKIETSTLRHFFDEVKGNNTLLIEPIDPKLFTLNNEYSLTYYVEDEIFFKKFTFTPAAMDEVHLTKIEQLGEEGILHS